MKKINNILTSNINKIFTIFLFSQPIIDVLTAISLTVFKIDLTIGMILRIIFMLFGIYYIFFITKSHKRKISIIYLLLIILYMISFTINILVLKGTSALSYEIKKLIKTFYFPIMLTFIYNLYDENKITINIKTLIKLFIIYLSFVFIPNILHIGFKSYAVTKGGEIGFFYTANEISAILSILMPIFIYELLEKKNILLLITSLIILLYVLTSMGTKGPLLCFIIILIYYFIKLIRKEIKTKKYLNIIGIFLSIILITMTAILLIPKTEFYKNIRVHLDFLKVESVTDIVTNPQVLDHFIFSQRLTFWNNTNHSYQHSKFSEKLLGIGYIENYATDKINMKMIEMDYIDIFYRHGILGTIIYMSSYIYMFILLIKKITKTALRNNLNQILMISILLSIILALLTGHVITSPSVSIYVALIMNLFYTQLRKGHV